MAGRYFAFCASLPKVQITGPTIFGPKGMIRGARARPISSSKM